MKKLISVILALLLVLSVFPVSLTAFAASPTLEVALGELDFSKNGYVGVPVYVTANSENLSCARFLVISDNAGTLNQALVIMPKGNQTTLRYEIVDPFGGESSYSTYSKTVGQGDRNALIRDLTESVVAAVPVGYSGYRIVLDAEVGQYPVGTGLLTTVYFENPTPGVKANYKLVWSDSTNGTSQRHIVTTANDTATHLIKATPAAPAAPELDSKTDSIVNLKEKEGYEYKIEGGEWKTEGKFFGLSPATTYKFYCRTAESDTANASESSVALEVTTSKKAGPNAPAAPTKQGGTDTSVTLVAVDGLEYKINDGAWQSSNIFTGLNPATSYSFYCRIAETATQLAGASSVALVVTTDKSEQTAPAAPTKQSATDTTVTLAENAGYEYKMNDGNWQTSNVFTGLSPATSYNFYCRKAETASAYASDSSAALVVTTDKSAAPAAPAAPELQSKTDSKVTLVAKDGLQYKIEGGEWQDSNVFTGLTPLTSYKFYCRIAETDTVYASSSSAALEVTTNDLPSPTISVELGEKDLSKAGYIGLPVYISENSENLFCARLLVISDKAGNLNQSLVILPKGSDTTLRYEVADPFGGESEYKTYSKTVGMGDKADISENLDAAVIAQIPDGYSGYRIVLDGEVGYAPVGTGLLATVYFEIPKDGGTVNYKLIWSDSTNGSSRRHDVTVGKNTDSYFVKYTADVPAAPTKEAVTDTTVTLTAKAGYEYKIEGGSWQSSNVFTGLSPATSYNFYCRTAETDTHKASESSLALAVTTDKAAGKTASAPTVESFTDTTVTLTAVAGMEYKIEGGSWQTSNVFTALSPATEYKFYCRYAETDTSYAGASSAALTKTTDKSKVAPPAAPEKQSFTDTSVTLVTVAGYEYKIEGGNWQTSGTFTGLSPATSYNFYSRKAETATTYASDSSLALAVTTDKATPAAPSAPAKDAVTDTTVTLVAVEGMEYKMNDGSWQTSNVFTGLSAETEYTFYCRKAETATTYASGSSDGLKVTTEPEYILGDVNGDRLVDAGDLALLKLYLANTMPEGTEFIKAAAHLNDDNLIDAADLAVLKLMLAGL